MPPLTSRTSRPVVLLTNDDGPPSASSPNIYGFANRVQEVLGWEVRVVVPDCQKSWVGKAYAISDIIEAKYFYPLGPDGMTGQITPYRRPLKEGETMEWVLLSGTPATCANIALHNLYPDEIDIVISGPNHGRNSSTAFSLSSGTIGAALGAALSVGMADPSPSSSSSSPTPAPQRPFIPAIALSYGLVERPCPAGAIEAAQDVAVDIVQRLWNDWGYECSTPCAYGPASSSQGQQGQGQVERHRTQLYTVNVPLVPEALKVGKRRTVWANMWRSAYGSLFKQTTAEKADYEIGSSAAANRPQYSSGNILDINANAGATSSPSEPAAEAEPASGSQAASAPAPSSTKEAGPAALPTPAPTPTPARSSPAPSQPLPRQQSQQLQQNQQQPLRFKFAPGMKSLLNPPLSSLPYGTDAWAFAQGWSTVVPLRAEFGGITSGRESWFERDGGERIVPGDDF